MVYQTQRFKQHGKALEAVKLKRQYGGIVRNKASSQD
jgi:hypothetical protein